MRRTYQQEWLRKRHAQDMADIYVLFDRDAIRYVGSTKLGAQERVRLHWASRFAKSTHVAGWLVTLPEPPQFLVVQEVCVADRWKAEEYWTDLLFKIPGTNLLNAVSGSHGVGGKDRIWSEEARHRLSAVNQGIPNPGVSGVRSGNSTLTEDQVREIRLASGTTRDIGARYDISRTAVSMIKRRLTYKDVE
jgi:hypothetical protein